MNRTAFGREQLAWSNLLAAARDVGWMNPATGDSSSPAHTLPSEPCLLRALLEWDGQAGCSSIDPAVRTRLERWLAVGATLRSAWPREWSAAITEWLGPRLYFAHASDMSPATPLVAIVSSRLGRNSQRLPRWPQLIDSILQSMRRKSARPLLVAGTTLYESVRQMGQIAELPGLHFSTPRSELAHSDWLRALLRKLESEPAEESSLLGQVEISPILSANENVSCHEPLQDRISLALADAVHVLSIRPGGVVERLLGQRLDDDRFPAASTYLALTDGLLRQPGKSETQWLDRGAVGWYLPCNERIHPELSCRARKGQHSLSVQQITAPLHRRDLAAGEPWPFLCHCTRGSSGRLPDESQTEYHTRQWLSGTVELCSPLEVLARICRHGCLHGNAELNRAQEAVVSFSEVPLAELLAGRTYRPHLGRWDWEPYGTLIRRRALIDQGARAVIYGDESDYRELDESQRPFFQPLGQTTRGGRNWSIEREYRLLGNLDLKQLPREAVTLFVRFRAEALQLARWCDWPVLWIEDLPCKGAR